MIQGAIDGVLGKTTLKDLQRKEGEMTFWLRELLPLDPRATPPRTTAPGQRA
jgi:hypothetical protein